MSPYGCTLQYDLRILWIDCYPTNYRPSQVIMIPKMSKEDTTLTIGNANGEKRTIPVPKGARITIDTAALHYNRENLLLGKAWMD